MVEDFSKRALGLDTSQDVVPPKSARRDASGRFTNAPLGPTANNVETVLTLPPWHVNYDQGGLNACVGWSGAMMMAIYNKPGRPQYNAEWLWRRSQANDGNPSNDAPGNNDGTNTNGCGNTLRDEGLPLLASSTPDLANGIDSYTYIYNVDEIRTAVSQRKPVQFGLTWFTNFDGPVARFGAYYIGDVASIAAAGSIRGGHCVCIYGASDHRQAFRIKNQWGPNYPLVWMPYRTVQNLINGGYTVELLVAVDKAGP